MAWQLNEYLDLFLIIQPFSNPIYLVIPVNKSIGKMVIDAVYSQISHKTFSLKHAVRHNFNLGDSPNYKPFKKKRAQCFVMAVDQENVSKILSVLSHPLRRQILLYISEKQECSFTDIATTFSVNTGKLSFHLRNLKTFLEQTPTGKYKLTRVGQNAIVLIKDLEAWAIEADIAKRPLTRPIANWEKRATAFLIDFTIAFLIFLALPNIFYPFTLEFTFLNINLIFFLVLFWIYLTLLEGFAGQSLGKYLMRIKVVRMDGKDMFYDHAAVRNFGKVFLLPIDLAVGLRLKDKRFIRFFDKFSGTTVIDIQPQPPGVSSVQPSTANKTAQS